MKMSLPHARPRFQNEDAITSAFETRSVGLDYNMLAAYHHLCWRGLLQHYHVYFYVGNASQRRTFLGFAIIAIKIKNATRLKYKK